MNTRTITRGEAVESIKALISQFSNGQEYDLATLGDVVHAVNKDVQVRDYLLGVPSEYPNLSIAQFADFINSLFAFIGVQDTVPFSTILGAFYFECERNQEARESLALALSQNKNYSLANLLARVMLAGWIPSEFTQMRSKLHSKVIAHLAETANEEVGSDNE